MRPLYLDGIIFSLQRAGGISAIWTEHLRRLSGHPYQLLLPAPSVNIFLAELALPPQHILRPAWSWPRLERYLPVRGPDLKAGSIFHSSYYRSCGVPGVRQVVTVYDFAYERTRKGLARAVHSWQKFHAIRQAERIVCISEATRADLERYCPEVPAERIQVLPLGVAAEFHPLSVPAALPYARPFIVYVGGRSHYKNFPLALKSLQLCPDVTLLVVGGGPCQPAEEQMLRSLGLSERVHFLGALSNVALNELYSAALALLYPSELEGFGIPVVEASRAGCPTVAVHCSSIPEVHGDHRLLVKELRPEAFAECLRALADPSFRAESVAKLTAYSQQFSWDRFHSGLMNIYAELS